jgi:hypothetical protein
MSSLPLPHVAFLLDGVRVDDLRGLDGLQLEAEIATNDLGPDNIQKKHVSAVRWTPAILTIGLGMGTAMANWISGSLARTAPPINGAIVMCDAKDRAQSTLSFANAVLTRFTLPTLDAASRTPTSLTVAFEAETVRIAKGDGSAMTGKPAVAKDWLCSGFKLEIGTLPCTRVTRIESFSWSVISADAGIGLFREPIKKGAKANVPDLQITIAAADFAPWAAAAQKWFIDGARLDGDEMAGRITLLASDGSELATLSLAGVGFRRFPMAFTPDSGAPSFTATLYVETMTFALKTLKRIVLR